MPDKARQRLVQGNSRLAVSIARAMARRLQHGSAMEFADLIQEAMIGLNTAALRFDPERGFTFSTYATWWCRQSCQRALETQSRTVRLPNSALTMLRRWRYRKPIDQSIAAFAEEHGYRVDLVVRTLDAAALTEVGSLDIRALNGDGASLLELLAVDGDDPLAGMDEASAVAELEALLPDEMALLSLAVVDGVNTTQLGALLDCSRSAAGKRLAMARERIALVAGEEARDLVATTMPATSPASMHEVVAEPAAMAA
jgi:RNA polymerase sigma factor (sigma-70 family)